jgi:hypothetical protein
VQQEKDGLSLPTPENTDSNNDDGVVWSELDEGSDDDVPLAAWAKGKDVVQDRVAAASAAGAASAGKGIAMVGVPGTGGAVVAGLEKTQTSGVDLTVSSIVVICVLPNFVSLSS